MTRATPWFLSRYAMAAALLVASACGPRGARAPAPVPGGEFVLRVVNHHWLDVVIHIVHNGTRTRVATVSATSTQTVILSARLLGSSGQMYLIGAAIGSPDAVRTETLLVQPGQYVEWTLESSLNRSSVVVF